MTGECVVDEIEDGIFRLSTHLTGMAGPAGISVNQFLVLADEPLLFHTGLRSMYPEVSAAVGRVLPLDRLRWLSFGHVEADECGSMNRFAACVPNLRVCFAARGGVLDLGGRRLRQIPTPHAPHNPEAQVLYEEVTRTLLCGDLASQLGAVPPLSADASLVERAVDAEELLRSASSGQTVPLALRRLAAFEPRTLAVMHGSSYAGDGGSFLRSLAAEWDARLCGAVA